MADQRSEPGGPVLTLSRLCQHRLGVIGERILDLGSEQDHRLALVYLGHRTGEVRARLLESRIAGQRLKDQFNHPAQACALGYSNDVKLFASRRSLELCVEPPDDVRLADSGRSSYWEEQVAPR